MAQESDRARLDPAAIGAPESLELSALSDPPVQGIIVRMCLGEVICAYLDMPTNKSIGLCDE